MCPSQQVDAPKAINTLLTIAQGLLITLANISMSAFQCFRHPNGKSSIYQFPQIICWENAHVPFLILSLWMLASVVVPFIVTFFIAVLKVYAQRNLIDSSILTLVR